MREEHQLLKLVASGNRNAFEKLYELHSAKVYNIALSYSQNAKDAEEITQDVFTSIFKKADGFKYNSAVATWIYRITVNTSLNAIKKNTRNRSVGLDTMQKEKADFEHPGFLLENKEKGKLLMSAIDQLNDRQKMVLILSYIEDLPRQEIADSMEYSLKAIESLLQRAKKNLRNILEKEYPNRRK